MKATVVEELPSSFNQNVFLVGFGVLFVLITIKMMTSRTVDLYGKVASILKDEPYLEAEDAGETNSSYLFSISISAITQHFDLNEFVRKMGELGCSVLSTADTDNPSFRKLTVQVPKQKGGVGLTTFLVTGMTIGGCIMVYYHQEELYNTFPFVETITEYYVKERTR